jgi:hypothetical protein
MTRFENVGVFIREKVWLENSLSQTFSRLNTPTFSNPVILHTYPPMKIAQAECSKTSAYKIQTPGNYPEESIQHSKHGERLKSRKLNNLIHHCRHLEANMFSVTKRFHILRKRSVHYHAHNYTPLDFILKQVNQSALSTLTFKNRASYI